MPSCSPRVRRSERLQRRRRRGSLLPAPPAREPPAAAALAGATWLAGGPPGAVPRADPAVAESVQPNERGMRKNTGRTTPAWRCNHMQRFRKMRGYCFCPGNQKFTIRNSDSFVQLLSGNNGIARGCLLPSRLRFHTFLRLYLPCLVYLSLPKFSQR